MGDLLIDLVLPRTDRAALIQLLVVLPIFALWIWRSRHDKDHLLLACGVSLFTLSWFALRTLH